MKTLHVDILNKNASAVGFGGWQAGGLHVNQGRSIGWQGVTHQAIVDAIEAALRIGINVFDTSDAYGPKLLSAQRLGIALKHVPRKDIIIHGKLGYVHEVGAHCFSQRNLELRCFKLLEALDLNYIDILSFHHDDFGENDVYLAEAVETLRQFKSKKIIGAIGVRIGHVHTAKPNSSYELQDVVTDHARLIKQCQPDFCSVSGALRGPVILPGFSGFWLINKPLYQGLLITQFDDFVYGDNRHNKPEFKAEALSKLRGIVGRYKLTKRQIIRGQMYYAQSLADKAITLVGFRTNHQVLSFKDALQEEINDDIFCCFSEIIEVLKELNCITESETNLGPPGFEPWRVL